MAAHEPSEGSGLQQQMPGEVGASPGPDTRRDPRMPDPTVRELLPAKVDELVAKVATFLAEIRAMTEPSSRNGPARAGTLARWPT
jgi:hypothetical protein